MADKKSPEAVASGPWKVWRTCGNDEPCAVGAYATEDEAKEVAALHRRAAGSPAAYRMTVSKGS